MKRFVPLLLLCACDSSPRVEVDFRRPPPVGVTGGAWVARFDGDTLTDAEVHARLKEMNPYARARYQTSEQRLDYVEGLVRFELLAKEAVKRGLHNDPEVVEAARRVMVQQLLKKELEDSTQISDAQVAAYYESHKADYVKPAMTRLTLIALPAGETEKAKAVLAQVSALQPLDAAAYGRLARENSSHESAALDGDLRFLSDEELTVRFGAALTAAAAKLERIGDVSPLVETDKGLFIIKLAGRQHALNLSQADARSSITQLLANESKQDRLRALLERLKREARYEVNTAALDAMQVDFKAPAVPAQGPQPGFIPAPPPVK